MRNEDRGINGKWWREGEGGGIPFIENEEYIISSENVYSDESSEISM